MLPKRFMRHAVAAPSVFAVMWKKRRRALARAAVCVEVRREQLGDVACACDPTCRASIQLKSFLLMTGRFNATSHVLLSSVPAFCHCVAKPSELGVSRPAASGRFVTSCAYVNSTPRRSNSVKSVPISSSVVVSGLSFVLPACAERAGCRC